MDKLVDKINALDGHNQLFICKECKKLVMKPTNRVFGRINDSLFLIKSRLTDPDKIIKVCNSCISICCGCHYKGYSDHKYLIGTDHLRNERPLKDCFDFENALLGKLYDKYEGENSYRSVLDVLEKAEDRSFVAIRCQSDSEKRYVVIYVGDEFMSVFAYKGPDLKDILDYYSFHEIEWWHAGGSCVALILIRDNIRIEITDKKIICIEDGNIVYEFMPVNTTQVEI